MPDKTNTNGWATYHAKLNDTHKLLARTTIMTACEWSQDTFYRKMKAPGKLKFWEKQLVAKAYHKKVHNFFTEVAKQPLPL
jgi:hypothetical protein